MLQNLPSQVLQSSMSRRSAEIEMNTIQHVALSGDQQPGVRCWPVAAVAEWVSFATVCKASETKCLDVAKLCLKMRAKSTLPTQRRSVAPFDGALGSLTCRSRNIQSRKDWV